MGRVFRMPSDELAGDAKRRVPKPKRRKQAIWQKHFSQSSMS